MKKTIRHPFYPKRPIRHAKTMLAAGFTIDMKWMRALKSDSLIYWKHPLFSGPFCVMDYQDITLAELVARIHRTTIAQVRKEARINFGKYNDD